MTQHNYISLIGNNIEAFQSLALVRTLGRIIIHNNTLRNVVFKEEIHKVILEKK